MNKTTKPLIFRGFVVCTRSRGTHMFLCFVIVLLPDLVISELEVILLLVFSQLFTIFYKIRSPFRSPFVYLCNSKYQRLWRI